MLPMRTEKPKRFRYVSVRDLAAALDLRPKDVLFEKLLNRIRQIARRIFNPDKSYEEQENEKIAEFSSMIHQEFADVFYDPDISADIRRQRTETVLSYCRRYFTSHRHTLQRNARRKANRSLSVPPPDTTAKKVKEEKVRRAEHRVVTPSRANTPSTSRQILRTLGPPLPTRYQQLAGPSGSRSMGGRGSSRAPSPPSSIASSSTLAHAALIARYQNRKPEACIGDVAQFLGTCDPDMRYLLPSFAAFGCRSAQFLIYISHLREDDIEVILKKIVDRHPPPEGVEEMDLVIVTKHFKTYFLNT